MRLNRYLSQCGVASRRGAEQIILEGRVSINGHVITNLATQVAPDDKVVVDGKPAQAELPVVIAINKPRGYICSHGDTHERMTIYDLLPLKYQNLHHVGRLDKESEGLILMTNRGDLSHRLMHPSMGAEKEYEVVVDQPLHPDVLAKLIKGMMTEEGHARAERAWLVKPNKAHVVLKQGLKRQIRLMFYHLGYEVERLTRIRIGWLQLRGLQLGGWKELKPSDVERFFKETPSVSRDRAKPVRKPAPDEGSDTFAPSKRTSTPRSRASSPSSAKRSARPGPSDRPKGRSAWSKTRRPR
ncbi:MAG: pseudouridine synthase [Prosthecobacter sp.]